MFFNQLPKNQPKKEFAVCVKGLDFPQDDLSVRFLNSIFALGYLWLEAMDTGEVNSFDETVDAENYRRRIRSCRSPILAIQRLMFLTRLVEWFELLAALGAEKIFLYNLEVHPNVTKVLYYVFPSFFL